MGRTLRQWIADLKDDDAQVRQQAAYALSRMGPRIRLALPALKEAVKDSDPSVRHYAVEALGYTGPQALGALLELLESEETRYTAITALQHLETDPMPELLKRLASGEVRQRRAAAAAMHMAMNYTWQQPGKVLPALRLALKDPDGLVRIAAMNALRATRQQQTIPRDFIVELLNDKDPDVRLRAVFMVLENEEHPESTIPALEKRVLDDPDKRVRVSAAGMIGRYDSKRSMAMLAIVREALKDDEKTVRERALSAIFHIVLLRDNTARSVEVREDAARAAMPDLLAFLRGHKQQPKTSIQQILWNVPSLEPEPKDVVPVLLEIARDGEPETSAQAARTLAFNFHNDPAVKSILPASIRRAPYKVRLEARAILLTLKQPQENIVRGLVDVLLKSDRPASRSQAAYILGEIGSEAKDAIPALRGALEDKSRMVRQSALGALLHLEPDRAAELTPTVIRVSDWQIRYPSETIQILQTRAGEVVPVLVQGLKESDPEYRVRAGLMLINFGPAARSAVPDLRVALENKEPAVRVLAAIALARINPQTEGILPALRAGLAFNDYAIREQVFQPIQNIGPAARELVPDLLRLLKNKSEGQFRNSAVFALMSIRPAAEEVEPVLAALIKDADPQVRSAALRGLGQIDLRDKTLLTTILDMVRDDPNRSRQSELNVVIHRFGPAGIEQLSKRLKDKDPRIRGAFLNLYVNMNGVNQDELYAVLNQALKDDAPSIRLMAAASLLIRDREANKTLEQVLPVIKQSLKSSDIEERRHAIGALGRAAERRHNGRNPPQEAISLLLEQAKAKDASTRAAAIGIWMHIHPTPKEAEPVLVEALKDKDARVRQAALSAFRFRPGRSKEVVPALIEMLKGKDDMAIHEVLNALAQADREDPTAATALLEYYRKLKPFSHMRGSVLGALGQCGADAKDAIPLCVDALKDEDDNLVQTAVRVLMQLDPGNKMLVSALVDVHGRQHNPDRRVGRPHPHDRVQKPLGAPAVKELCDILANDKEPDRRAGAAIVLGTMVQDPKGAENALKNAMKDAEPRVRLHAADAYWLVTKDSRTPMPVLLAALTDKDVMLRQLAAQVVAEMGKEASHALPQLIALLKDKDDRLAGMLIYALTQMGPDAAPAIPALVDIVRDGGDSGARVNAARALMPFGRDAKDAVPGLLEMLKGGRHDRGTAAMALAKIATPAEALPALLEVFVESRREFEPGEHAITEALIQFGPAAVGPVAEFLQHKRPEVRIKAINLLVRYGKQAQFIVPQLVTAMDDKDDDVALSAAEAVWQMERRSEVLPHLVRGLNAKSANSRVRAARNLMHMGAEAKAAVPDLVAACKDRDSAVRREAYRALSLVDNETARKVGDPEADKK
jgi:HEAT repeat protein